MKQPTMLHGARGGSRALPSSTQHLSKDELLSHLEVMSKQLSDITEQRDDLAKDVELLCMDSGSATFDRSSILQERLRNTEIELARLREAHHLAVAERDAMADDNAHMKATKKCVRCQRRTSAANSVPWRLNALAG